MSFRSLLLGLLLGFGAGWVASSLSRPQAYESPDPIAVDTPPGTTHALEPVELAGHATRSGADAPQMAAELPALQRRLEKARIGRDGRALAETVRELAHLGTAESYRLLLHVLKDPDVHLPRNLAHDLHTWLADAEVEGVAEAAKARFAIRREAGYDLLRASAGWFALIGAHDGRTALDWARSEGWHEHAALWRELVTGFLRSAHPQALAFARELALRDVSDPRLWQDNLRDPKMIGLAFRTWARLDPATGVPALVRELELTLAPRGSPRALPPSRLLALYARYLPDDSVSDATALIRNLADREHYAREAWGLIHKLEVRGLDLAPLADIVLRPAVLLEEAAAHGGPVDEQEAGRVQQARTWILSYPWAWSDRSLEAVERSIAWERWPADQEALRAQLLEARTQRRWSGTTSD